MSTINLKLVSAGLAGDVGSSGASADGRYVLVVSTDGSGSRWSVVDTQTGDIRTAATEGPTNDVESASISADGRYVVFDEGPFDLTPGAPLFPFHKIYRWDRTTGNTEIVSPSATKDQLSLGAIVSGDGRYVTFYSNAPDLVRNDTNDDYDVFVADMQLGGIRRIYEHGATHDISADGRYVLVGSSPNGGDPDLKRI